MRIFLVSFTLCFGLFSNIASAQCESSPCGFASDGGGPFGNGCFLSASAPAGYTCSCQPGYAEGGSPPTCVVASECTNGQDDCDTSPTAVCADPNPAPNSLNDFTCTCPSGWAQHPVNDGHGANGCIDVDECASGLDNCDANATCMNSIGSFMCMCNAGYQDNGGSTPGTDCVDVDECAMGNPCGMNEVCMNMVASPPTCACAEGTSRDDDDVCRVLCNDGLVGDGEACDDGDANSDTEPNACRTDCVLAACGDLVIDDDEECDDGNQNGTPGATCDNNCVVVPQASHDAGPSDASPADAGALDAGGDILLGDAGTVPSILDAAFVIDAGLGDAGSEASLMDAGLASGDAGVSPRTDAGGNRAPVDGGDEPPPMGCGSCAAGGTGGDGAFWSALLFAVWARRSKRRADD